MSTCSVGRISTPKAISEEGVKPSRVYDTQTQTRNYDSDSTQDFSDDLVQNSMSVIIIMSNTLSMSEEL